MDKSIFKHEADMTNRIADLSGKNRKGQAEDLYYYHVDRVHDFQHERQIHLNVTFFFSFLLLLDVFGLLWASGLDVADLSLLTWLFVAAGLILFVTVLLYVRYYYRLENGVQRLYSITERLHQIITE